MWKKIQKYYSPLIDVITFLVLILTIAYVISQYGQLPDEVPRHFGLTGEPTAWSGKGIFIGLLVLQTYLLIQLFIINYFLIIYPDDFKDALHLINIPFIKKEELTDNQIYVIRQYVGRMMAILNLLVCVMFSYIHYSSIQTALGHQYGMGMGVLAICLFMILIPLFYTWRIYQLVKE